jgi:hypothetical protein
MFFSDILDSLRNNNAMQSALQADTSAAAPVKPSPQITSNAGWLAPLINSFTPFIQNTITPDRSLPKENNEIKGYNYFDTPNEVYTLFNQIATDPITRTEGKRYAFGGMTDSTPQFNNPFGPQTQPQQVQPQNGGGYNQQSGNVFGGFAPQPMQFQNPFGQQQPPNGQRMYNPGPTQPQSVSVGGSPQQSGLPSLLSTNTQNQYPNGYTPIGPKQQNFISSY